jgi:GGDEF domain-containing protein
MSNLKNSIAFLFVYLILVFGVAQVNYIEQNILNFEPAFFVLIALAVLIGFYLPSVSRVSIYAYLFFWAVVYVLVWWFYWRVQEHPSNIQILGIQFILVTISAGLAFDVGQHLRAMNTLFEGLSVTTYPNRTLEIQQAEDRISAELTRSRRYHHPLSLLIVELEKNRYQYKRENLDGLQKDLLRRFAIARIGQIISDGARETDLILRDQSGRFVLLCPETDFERSKIFGDRIRKSVAENMDAQVVWSSASFPDEALTFDELIERAEQRLAQPQSEEEISIPLQAEERQLK